VRMLSNLETDNEKLIQIIFLGQPQLRDKLSLPRLEQLRQRIAVYFHLSPLSREETLRYIRHRLKIASGSERAFFAPGALEEIYGFTRGVPRMINQICDSALLSGFIYGVDTVDEKVVREVIEESPIAQLLHTNPKKTDQQIDSPADTGTPKTDLTQDGFLWRNN